MTVSIVSAAPITSISSHQTVILLLQIGLLLPRTADQLHLLDAVGRLACYCWSA